jgi:hypothetical protein
MRQCRPASSLPALSLMPIHSYTSSPPVDLQTAQVLIERVEPEAGKSSLSVNIAQEWKRRDNPMLDTVMTIKSAQTRSNEPPRGNLACDF